MTTLLEIDNLNAWYGSSHVLHGASLRIGEGEIVALAGRNGSGRSTLAKALMGLVHAQGVANFRGVSMLGKRPYAIARMGVGYVPEQRDVFPTLSVIENLQLGMKRGGSRLTTRFTLNDAEQLFPVLRERAAVKAGMLSGGEQQMLALARTLMGDPSFVIVDEPTEGLAPQVVAQVSSCLKKMRERGVAILLIEQRMSIARELATRVAVMGHGAIVFDDTPAALAANERVISEWLSVGG
ncbi:High-affinity branched-chain amino acid transport ATP-binding protein LivF [Caballeronia sp. SBC1]|uniref:ABC transporter ATP-binding protein n=1 Tax=unclassified Caballeronia TaxID=2646786 RepID=UPI0013E1878B|nr:MULTISPECIES: ABC transporter ATP-binding protein [unclassified Caballeronia]QIE24463.1 High-affinity branched-chain amino acid transport ATP-binding protein LivF [Caballeronia sp. SBC2]QIN62354.1 High-affinity branched-chain amino acid transport ATP-binding protein LivF [Caballeronia sp. SBC1]